MDRGRDMSDSSPVVDTGEIDTWWRAGLLYQIYVRSFADSNGDGIGDLRGVIQRMDHLSWLGVDGIWLSPLTRSPNADWGYDVSDYRSVQQEYGSLGDLDELIETASRRGIRVLLDLVPNHTSDRHRWFTSSRSSRDSPYREFYVWADPSQDGSPPNNWVSSFGGAAWTFEDATGQFYLHNFLQEQPDLNWWYEDVRGEFDAILRFWWDRGVAGFRIDVCHMIVKDAELRDNPPATDDDPFMMRLFGQRPVFTSNRPEVHDVLKHWREIAAGYDPPRVLLGETNVEELETLVSFYGQGEDELNMAFNFPFIEAPFEAGALRSVVERTEELLPLRAWPVWTGSNHDVSRLASRWAGGDLRKVKMALLMLLTLRGTPVLYQGDEIGLTDLELSRDQLLDPVGIRYWPAYPGRDPVRTPMPWHGGKNGGFTDREATPWLPMGDPAVCNVDDQRRQSSSVLWFTRGIVELRRRSADLVSGPYRSVPSPDDVWAWQRGSRTLVALNFSDLPTRLDLRGQTHTIAASTDPGRELAAVARHVDLAPWEGVVLVEKA
jgi:alpha-glucosidase